MRIKPIIKLFIISIFFFVFTNNSFAAEIDSSIFDFSKTSKLEQIKATSKTGMTISLLPFTTITIKEGSFPDDVTLSVYEGNFDKIKALLPKGQSPISSYYLIFKDQEGMTVFPSIPIYIESVNNYSNTDTFYYSLLPEITIDKQNQKKWSGNGNLVTNLPIKNSGFIVATNKNLDKNDIALNVGKSMIEPEPPSSLESKISTNPILLLISKVTEDSLLLISSILVIITGMIFITFWLIWKRRK